MATKLSVGKRTPGKWYAEDVGGRIIIDTRDTSAPWPWIARTETCDDTDWANAERIVRASNSHDELVETLQECLEDIEDAHDNHIYSEDDDHPRSKDDCRYCCTMKRIKAALKAAKGE